MARVGFGIVFLAGAMAWAGDGEELVISGAGQTGTHACQAGQGVLVNGSSHNLTFTGDCGTVVVNGTGNVIGIEAAVKISVQGVGNRVTWQRGVGTAKKPKLTRSGLRNKIIQGTVVTAATSTPTGSTGGAGTISTGGGTTVVSGGTGKVTVAGGGAASSTAVSHGAEISFIDNGQETTKVCAGANVSVTGNENKLTLTGECGEVKVSGNKNQVKVESAKHLLVLGSDNEVTWRRGVGSAAPKITNVGSNKVTQY